MQNRFSPYTVSPFSEVYFAVCKGISTPRALTAWLLYQSGEHEQLAGLDIQPVHYCSEATFKADYAVTEYLKKYTGLNTGLDLREVALGKFNQSELRCSSWNKLIKSGVPLKGGADSTILSAKRKIASLLGPFHYGKVIDGCRWGPGATASLAAAEATLDNKILERELSVTLHALPFFKAVMSSDIHWLRARGIPADGPTSLVSNEFKIVEGGRLAVVPKNAKTDRTILVEPTGNLFLQFGVGSFIRARLRTVGIDLNSQDLNRGLAGQGYATIDLKAASDTVYRELVYQLLPLDWAFYLDCIRSKRFTRNGQDYTELQKFSSMGNGFTFELESMIFWAIARSVLDSQAVCDCVSVFGDDIVVPVGSALEVCNQLEAVGFELNHDKTFIEGPFRESCGSHWWEGRDVTPVYQKEMVTNKAEFIRCYNRLIRLSLRLGKPGFRDSRLHSAVSAHLRLARKGWTDCAQPDSNGPDDGLLVFASDPPELQRAASRQWRQRPKLRKAQHEALLAYTLRFNAFTGNESRGVCDWVFTLPHDGHVSVRSGGAYCYGRRRRSLWSMSDATWD